MTINTDNTIQNSSHVKGSNRILKINCYIQQSHIKWTNRSMSVLKVSLKSSTIWSIKGALVTPERQEKDICPVVRWETIHSKGDPLDPCVGNDHYFLRFQLTWIPCKTQQNWREKGKPTAHPFWCWNNMKLWQRMQTTLHFCTYLAANSSQAITVTHLGYHLFIISYEKKCGWKHRRATVVPSTIISYWPQVGFWQDGSFCLCPLPSHGAARAGLRPQHPQRLLLALRMKSTSFT